MAKFKRFDPRNKRANKEKYLASKETRRDKLTHHMMAAVTTQKRKYDEKGIYTLEQEFEL